MVTTDRIAPSAPEPTSIAKHFRGPIDRVPVSLGYQAALFLIALGMLLLPLVYLALIAATGWAVYFHATENVRILESARGPVSILFRLVAYVGPLVAGVTLVFFMLKPMLAPSKSRPSLYTLEPGQEPWLYSFVESVANAINAPTPRIIRVNCQVNASAGFRRGFLSLFTNDLELTVGMPLAAGLNTRQLAGVVAHELGHFSQFFAMRADYIINRVNSWFARVVYQRDAWDEKLEEAALDTNLWFWAIITFTRLCVWASRRVLWLLMMTGHAMSAIMSRQMEFNADRYEIRLAGSEAFEATALRMQELSVAHMRVEQEMPRARAAHKLADDLPALIAATAHRIPPNVRAAMNKGLETERAGLFRSHPTTRSRIARAKRENAPGVLDLEQPSSKLFRNFGVLCKWVTIGHYQATFGEEIPAGDLVPVEGVVEDGQVFDAAVQTFRRYSQDLIKPVRPLFLDAGALSGEIDERAELTRLAKAVQAVSASSGRAKKALDTLNLIDEELSQLHISRGLLRTGIKCKLPNLKYASAGADGLQRAGEDARQRWRSALAEYSDFETAMRHRLTAALRLLASPQAAAKIQKSKKLFLHAQTLCECLGSLRDAQEGLIELRRDMALLMWMLELFAAIAEPGASLHHLFDVTRDVHTRLCGLRTMLSGQRYPLQASEKAISVAAYVFEVIPPPEDVGGVASCADESVNRLLNLYLTIMGRLTLLAEKVERVVGVNAAPQRTAEPAT